MSCVHLVSSKSREREAGRRRDTGAVGGVREERARGEREVEAG